MGYVMSDITVIKQSELEVMLKASIYLRQKLLNNDRNGPLVKLLTREIDLFNDEVSRRRDIIKTQTAKQVKVVKPTPVKNMTANAYDGKTTILPKKTAVSSTGRLEEVSTIQARKPATPIQRPTVLSSQSTDKSVRNGLLSKVTPSPVAKPLPNMGSESKMATTSQSKSVVKDTSSNPAVTGEK